MAVEVGTKVAGKPAAIAKFGAFVELGDGKTGLVHIREVSDAYVKDIHDVLHVGEPVTVKVLSIQDGKIGLSIRKAVDKPQQRENDHYHENRRAPRHMLAITASKAAHAIVAIDWPQSPTGKRRF